MSDINKPEKFGDFSQYEKAKSALYEACTNILKFPREREHERYFLLAVARRTLSLEAAFRQSIDACNGQIAMTLVRLNLDTLARFYALYWADETHGMSAATFARQVAQGKSIKDMKFRGSKEKASDRWLIQQIESLGSPCRALSCGLRFRSLVSVSMASTFPMKKYHALKSAE
jgi:hypothetical protein